MTPSYVEDVLFRPDHKEDEPRQVRRGAHLLTAVALNECYRSVGTRQRYRP